MNGLRKITMATVAVAALILGVPSLAVASECPDEPTHYTTPTDDSVVNEVARVGHSVRELCIKQSEEAQASTEAIVSAVEEADSHITDAISSSAEAPASTVTREDVWSLAGLLIGFASAVWIALILRNPTE